MKRWLAGPLLLIGLLAARTECAAATSTVNVSIFPKQFTLRGKDARQRLIVTVVRDGRAEDRTREAKFRSDTPSIAGVEADGTAFPLGDGTGAIVATVDGQEAGATVHVAQSAQLLPVTFERDVLPLLARAGCNAGACHGKARGQNGFQLSLLGFDPDVDYAAITAEGRGRRIFPAAPEQSLLVLKASGRAPHGGGRRLPLGSAGYESLLRWVAAAAPRTPRNAPTLDHISVEPPSRLLAGGAQQQLLVTAHYTDGSRRDVTHLASFQSNESGIAAVGPDGLVRAGPMPGEAAIMARFMEKFAVCNVLIPMQGIVAAAEYDRLPRANFIDGHVWEKLRQLGITPSAPANDATFLRRAHLDVIGRLPTPQEARAFLADRSPDKRGRLIDRLLARPEYADFWANKWADLLRPNPYRVGVKAVYNLDAWLRDCFRRNKPYDQFVRELVTARGSTFRDGPVTVFRDRREPDEITTLVSQLFLGIRLDCARCHHHPFEAWGQDDFYSLAAYFACIGRKGTGVSPPISGEEEVVFTAAQGEVRHPLTNRVLPPRPLFGKAPATDEDHDPREALADWIVSPQNPYFARVIVNRVWADLMGRGLVEPVDDLRATNPPTNPALLDALAEDFRQQGHDLKKLLRTILSSHAYGLSARPGPRNVADTRNYSRHYRQRLRAEALLDAVSDVTGVPERFNAMPPGSRAVELWTVRSPSLFLDSFGRPDPNRDPPCERTVDTTVVQALHLMNAPNLHRKIASDEGRAAALAASKKTPSEIIEELYFLAYARPPDDTERRDCLEVFSGKGVSRRRAVEDLLWALVNTAEFLFKD